MLLVTLSLGVNGFPLLYHYWTITRTSRVLVKNFFSSTAAYHILLEVFILRRIILIVSCRRAYNFKHSTLLPVFSMLPCKSNAEMALINLNLNL